MNLTPEAFQPRVGLSSIEIATEGTQPQLPDDSMLQPTDAAVEAQLEAMLEAKTFDRMVMAALKPQVSDQSILRPTYYHALREEIGQKLTHSRMQSLDPAMNEELDAALRLLSELGDAHHLGETYRYALLKG